MSLVQQKRREQAMAKTAKWQVLKSKGDKLAKRSVYMYIAPGAHNEYKMEGAPLHFCIHYAFSQKLQS